MSDTSGELLEVVLKLSTPTLESLYRQVNQELDDRVDVSKLAPFTPEELGSRMAGAFTAYRKRTGASFREVSVLWRRARAEEHALLVESLRAEARPSGTRADVGPAEWPEEPSTPWGLHYG